MKDCKTILDVGAGDGLFYDEAVRAGKDITGIVIDEKVVRDNIILKDYKDIDLHYDCFFNCQFIEHVDCFKFFDKVKEFCDKKIITMATTPGWGFWDCPEHIRPYSKEAIRRLCVSIGFKVIFNHKLLPTNSFMVIGKNLL